jgi:hypothetical protein
LAALATAAATAASLIVPVSGWASSGPTAVPCDADALLSTLQTLEQTPTGDGELALSAGCTYTYAQADNGIDGPNALPVIHGHVVITGNGATIARDPSAPPFRFFTVDGIGFLELSDLTLRDGAMATGETQGGGAILNRWHLHVTDVTFDGNTSAAKVGAGAIDNHDMGQLLVERSTFIGNTGLQGGAIENEATYCDTTKSLCSYATITDSTFSGNTTTMFGGGAVETQHAPGGNFPPCPSAGECEMPDGAHTTLQRDTFVDNVAHTEGGAIANFGTTALSDSTITGNRTNDTTDFGGGGIQNTGTLTMSRTTVAANISAFGANLHTYDNTGAGMPPPVTTVSMSLLAGSAGTGASCDGTPPITDAGYNLDTGTSCGFSDGEGSLSNTDPQLGPLGDNGGATETMALPAGSPAVDVVPVSTPGCDGTDQRGVPRPSGPRCDIGAFERGTLPPPTPSVSPSTSPTPSASASPSTSPSPTASPTTAPPTSPAPTGTETPTPSPTVTPPTSSVPPSTAAPRPQPAKLSPCARLGASARARPARATAGRASIRLIPAGEANGVTCSADVRRVHQRIGYGLLATRRGATILIAFRGDRIELHFIAGPTSGRVRITVGGHAFTVDLYARTTRDKKLSWRLARGAHVVRIVATGTHDADARGTRVLLATLGLRAV